MKTRLLITSGIIVIIIAVIAVAVMSMNDQKDDMSFPYDVNPDRLITRSMDVSAHVAMDEFPDKVCYEITDTEYDGFPEKLKRVMVDARGEILTSEYIAEYGKEHFFFEDVKYFDGHGDIMHPNDALDFLKKYNSFKLTEKPTNQNIGHIDDVAYSFECDINYKDHQYRLSFRFEPLYPSWENFVILNITENSFGMPIIQNPDITVYPSFNATVLFANNLDHTITLSRQGGTIQDRGISFDRIVIPAGQSWPYTLRTWNLDDDSGQLHNTQFNYEIQPGNILGKVTVKNYPKCMTENEVTSLYSKVNAYPKFPSYLPDGYSFECGIHNMNAYVHMTYWTDEIRSIFEDKRNDGLSREFFAKGGIAVDYYNYYILNEWKVDPQYGKHENSKRDNEDHPNSRLLSIDGNPAVMAKEYFWEEGEQYSYNELQVYLDEGITYRVRSGLPEDQVIRIAESLFENY